MGFDIFAVEANKSLAFKLKSENIFSRISVLNAVVGAESESIMFYENINHGISSVIRPRSDEIKNIYELKTITLDDFSYLAPMIMKIDIEGCEKQAIKGATKILEYVKPVCLLEVEREDIRYFVDLFSTYEYKPLAYFYRNKSFEFFNIEETQKNMIKSDSPIRTNILFLPSWLGEIRYSELVQ
jgi:FkbM family methyltransferase